MVGLGAVTEIGTQERNRVGRQTGLFSFVGLVGRQREKKHAQIGGPPGVDFQAEL